MQIALSFDSQPDTRHNFIVSKEITAEKLTVCKVYKVFSPIHQSHFLLKIFPKNVLGNTQYAKEKNLLNFSHLNVIQAISSATINPKFSGILTEYAPAGDFFDVVTKGTLNSEVLIRTYFHQLIEGLDHVHSKGFAHLDLKLENLMLSSDFKLKLIDFDQSQSTTDETVNSKGTEGYRAPEVINSECRNLTAADLYSAGIILYAMKARKFPFVERDAGEEIELTHYSRFMNDNEGFWDMKAEHIGDKTLFSEDFKELVNGMLNSQVDRRFTISDIKNSKWYQGPVLDNETLQAYMSEHVRSDE